LPKKKKAGGGFFSQKIGNLGLHNVPPGREKETNRIFEKKRHSSPIVLSTFEKKENFRRQNKVLIKINGFRKEGGGGTPGGEKKKKIFQISEKDRLVFAQSQTETRKSLEKKGSPARGLLTKKPPPSRSQ